MSDIKSKINTTQDINVINGNDLVANIFDNQQVAKCVDQINELPESIDNIKIIELKKKIESNNYNWDENLDKVVDNLIDESINPNPIAYPLFDK